jgi:hypothetical protein
MGRILSLLKAAASERSLHSKMGAWRLAVSAKLDSLTSGGGGSALLEFFNQGVSIGNFARVNFTGAGVTASVAGNVVDVAIPGGGAAAAECGVNAYMLQATWFVNAVTGSDANDGATPATALATTTELACRLNDKSILQDTVITLDGDFSLEDFHARLAPAPNTTTTIVGTPTASATRTVASFTPYDETAHTAAVLDTTPGVINTFANQRVRDSATGAVGWLLAFPSATTATTSYFTDFFGSDTQLNPGDTEFVEDVTATQLGWIHVENVGSGDLVIRDLAISPQVDKPMTAKGGVATNTSSLGRLVFFGVLFPFNVGQPSFQDSNADFTGCMWESGVPTFSTGVYQMYGPTFQGCTPVFQAGSWLNADRIVNRAGGFQMTGGAQANVVNHGFITVGTSGGVDIGDMAFYRFSGRMWQTAPFAAPVLYGIDVHNGGGVYYGANKPELTGSVNDTSVGGTPKAYAAIPYTDALNLSRIVASTT